MPGEKFITGIDIGTSKTRALVATRNKEGNLELVVYNQEESDGIRRGTVVGVERASDVLQELCYRTAQDVGQEIISAYVNVSGSHLFSVPSRGLVSVSRADRKISQEDVQRALEAAKTISLSSNKEIFETYPKEYIVDDTGGIRDPLGLEGVRLEVKILAVGGFGPYVDNVEKAVLDADLEIMDMAPSVWAAARSALSDKEKERGVALVDIGAGITSVAVFEEGKLLHLAVLPMGSSNITNDIAIGLKTDIETAESIKIEYGSCFLKGKDKERKIDLGKEEPLVFSQKFLVKVISDRVSEILDQANKELKKISKDKRLPAGIVLTGGGAKTHRIEEMGKKKFELPVRLGYPQGVLGVEDDLSMATVCGLVLWGADMEEQQGGDGFFSGVTSKIKRAIKIFIP